MNIFFRLLFILKPDEDPFWFLLKETDHRHLHLTSSSSSKLFSSKTLIKTELGKIFDAKSSTLVMVTVAVHSAKPNGTPHLSYM